MSSHITGRILKSAAWKFFRIKDKELKLAKCKICQSVLTYRTSVTNLIKHVRRKHKKSLLNIHEDNSDKSENGEVSNFSVFVTDDDDCRDDDLEDNKATKVLESLENNNEEESVCLLCQETFQEQSSDAVMKHMLKVHNISQIKVVAASNIQLDQEEDKPVQNTRLKQSRCWDYFTVKDKELRLAVCSFCDKELSYKSCVSNLIKHVQRKHHIRSNQGQDLEGGSSKEKVTNRPKSAVWSFFNYTNYEKTECACIHCKKEFNVDDGLENMKKHLLDKHPEALLHHKSNGDPLFLTDTNVEMSDDDNLQVEYLDSDEGDMIEKSDIKPSLEQRSYDDQRPSYDRRPSYIQGSTSERGREQRTRKPSIHRSPDRSVTQTKLPESLEHFTNYVTSLLQELPEIVSKRLQMNFVKQIIEAQISCDEMKNAAKNTFVYTNSAVGDTDPDHDPKMIVDESMDNEKATTTNIRRDGAVIIIP